MPEGHEGRDLDSPEAAGLAAAGAGAIANNFHGAVYVSSANFGVVTTPQPPTPPQPEEADGNQMIMSRFMNQALGQAETTFRLSVIFMSAGAVILLAGGVLALLRHGASAGDAAALMTSLAGVLIGSCGGAFAVHANRARKHLTEQVALIRADVKAERAYAREDQVRQQALRLVEGIPDAAVRQELMKAIVMGAVGQPAPASPSESGARSITAGGEGGGIDS